ncbi:MAG: IS110 family transposase [Algisphaera sp.]
MATSYSRTAGIDISKMHLDIAFWPKPHLEKRHDNTPESAKRLAQDLKQQQVELVVIEATGGYECRILTALREAGLEVHLAQPRRVRYFANAHGFTAKTDRIDAQVLALYGAQAQNIHPCKPETEQQYEIEALRKRCQQLMKDRIAEQCRLGKLEFSNHDWEKPMMAEVRRSIKQKNHLMETYGKKIEALLLADDQLKAKLELLESQRGVGRKTAVALIVGLPELGKVNRKRIASLVGVACFARDSGSKTGRRSIRGGRKDVRSALYMANLSNTRKGSALYDVYQSLRKRGKPTQVAQIAVMRRFLIQLNTLMRQHYLALEADLPAAAAGHGDTKI